MKIGIIVFSQKGHTLSVSEKLCDRLTEKGHDVQLEQIKIQGEATPGKFQITSQPAIDSYEALVFAAPVQAFSLNPVMDSYLVDIPDLSGKTVACLTTKQLPFHWTGGNRAVKTMEKKCLAKGARSLGSSVVVWKESDPSAVEIESAVSHISSLFAV